MRSTRGTISCIERPGRAPLYQDHGHPMRNETHRVTSGGGELLLWEQLANSREYQVFPFQSHELHPAEADSSVTAGVVGEDDLVRRQRHPKPVREEHKCTGGTVSENWERRDAVELPDNRRRRREVDEQRNVVHDVPRLSGEHGDAARQNRHD